MNTTNEKLAAAQLLRGYADVLNRADLASISSFYAFEGLFMPDGFNTLTKEGLDVAGRKFLRNGSFKINYDIKKVTVGNEFTFVDATARTL